MNKTKIIGAVGIGVIAVLLLIWVIVAINVSKIEPVIEVTEVVEVVEIIQDSMLQKLIDEPGIEKWRIISYDNDKRVYVDVEFKSFNGTDVELSRRFDSPLELNENINSILEEARKLK